MKRIYQESLFEKNILVSVRKHAPDHPVEVIAALAALFGIRVTGGSLLAQKSMIPFVSAQLGIHVPEPFYKGFPNSVRDISEGMLLADQLLHYFQTYGMGLFDEPGHSLFEPVIEKAAFREETAIRDFTIVTEDEAEERIEAIAGDLLMSTRPLSERQYALVREYMKDSGGAIEKCASKNTAVRLLADTRNLSLTRFLNLSDVIRLVDEINYRSYRNPDIRKLNLRNQDRKFITRVIDRLMETDRFDLEECCEKKALWCGLLHHLHYQPHGERAERFTACMRGRENLSVYSAFEKAMKESDLPRAVEVLQSGKGTAAVLRSLNRLLSRCASQEEVEALLEGMESPNVIVLVQLLLQYANRTQGEERRSFAFTRYNRMKVHQETDEEVSRRRSVIPEAYAETACRHIRKNIQQVLKGRLGKVYVDADMRNIALPLQENTSQGGFGVLSRGSRIPLEDGKKIRAFTYWEKVDDIDLSVIGLGTSGEQKEFSWRTMANEQSDELTFSGDQTSGYNGGSEYFDVVPELFMQRHPGIRYLVFCDNVYSASPFSQCVCRAGYMLRDLSDSGEVFEPKTVQSSYAVNCESTFAYLFALDLEKREFIWLNTVPESHARVAGDTSLDFLTRYFEVTSVINMYTFFEMMAEEMVENPSEADVIVSDRAADARDGAEIIRSCDFEKVLAYLNA